MRNVHKRISVGIAIAALGTMLVSTSWAKKDDCESVTTMSFPAAKMIIEYNSTAEDVGVQFFLDAEEWRSVRILDPDGLLAFRASAKGALLEQGGGTELFLESVEPELTDLPLSEFFERFPEGEYRFTGRTPDCEKLVSDVTFTHDIPAGPEIVAPGSGGESCGADTAIPAVVQWETVTMSIDDTPINVVRYEVIVEEDVEDAPRVFDVFLGADATQVVVPAEFLEAGTDYVFEVLAIEEGGNQTISEGCFTTAE